MQHFDMYNDILDQYSDDSYEQVQVLREAKAKLDKGVLKIKSKDGTEKEKLKIMKKWRKLEQNEAECTVERCDECSIFSEDHCQTCSSDSVLNIATG